MPQELVPGLRVLNGRYRLIKQCCQESNDPARRTWLAFDDESESMYLLAAWVTPGEPDLVLRALWDRELRVLYRASSAAGADSALLVLREAQFDRPTGAFMLLTEGPGYETLLSQIQMRPSCAWLTLTNLKDFAARRSVWQGLRRIAVAIRGLHVQQIIHRNISPESVFLSGGDGPATMRLGSFEWSMRVGAGNFNSDHAAWSVPPEVVEGKRGYSFDCDWYAFGLLLARTFMSLESWAALRPHDRAAAVLREVESISAPLMPKERDFIGRLLTSGLSFADEIIREIDDLIASLGSRAAGGDKAPLNLVVPVGNFAFVEALVGQGFQPVEDDPKVPYSDRNPAHRARLLGFVREDLEKTAQIYGSGETDRFYLKGQRTTLKVSKYNDHVNDQTWDFAFVSSAAGTRLTGKPLRLVGAKIQFLDKWGVKAERGRPCRSWEPLVPKLAEGSQLDDRLVEFHDFLRCTNQLELLIRDAEIFAYEMVGRNATVTAVSEQITIREAKRRRPVAKFCHINGGLLEMLQRVLDTKSGPNDNKVYLTVEDSLEVNVNGDKDAWTIEAINTADGTIQLARIRDGQGEAPTIGHLRTYGLYAQVTLIQRRTQAISRLQEHSFLLRALSHSARVFMDTGASPEALRLDKDKLDSSKRAVIEDVLRVRPIYTLQGPPGTGKTTLVAHLFKQILDDDPVAQILVTAPTHGAVDVLRDKVRDEVYVDESSRPLAVRLGRDKNATDPKEGTVRAETMRLLSRIARQLEGGPPANETQRLWRELINRALVTGAPSPSISQELDVNAQRLFADFMELVKRGASITYCTTSAYDLEELAKGNHSFDWSIVEEAGKTHGFDLALPLQAGHRWLLLGDHKQLPPFNIPEYVAGIAALDDAVASLLKLPNNKLVDREWAMRWQQSDISDKQAFQVFCRDWVWTFGNLFSKLSDNVFGGEEKTTIDSSVGAARGRLRVQYRMHPTIGSLISKAFYPDFGGITNATAHADSGEPRANILHGIRTPLNLAGKAILWIDTPWCERDPSCRELGVDDNKPRYVNPSEVRAIRRFLESLDPAELGTDDIAVLSLYSAQVSELRRELNSTEKLKRLRFKQSTQRTSIQGLGGVSVHTVDSFQGNEADIVLVSLVRNNSVEGFVEGEGLGFLKDDSARFNVLLSRAQKLLILVGSWEFFQRQLANVPRTDSTHKLWAMRTAMDEIANAIEEKRATRIDAATLLRLGAAA